MNLNNTELGRAERSRRAAALAALVARLPEPRTASIKEMLQLVMYLGLAESLAAACNMPETQIQQMAEGNTPFHRNKELKLRMEEEVIKVLSELHYYIQGSPAKPTIRAAG